MRLPKRNPNPELNMIIADRLRELREARNLSQGDIEKRTGLHRCYVSRVEGGYTVPSIANLEIMARALEVPMYALFYEGEGPPKLPDLQLQKSKSPKAWGSSGKNAKYLDKLRGLVGRATEADRKLLLHIAKKMADR
jgi:transcriptional regulator with XRE-family HTH domain